MDVRAIDADQNDLPATLDSDLRGRTEWDVSHAHLPGWSFDPDIFASLLSVCHADSSEQRRDATQGRGRLQ
jgi:hypothetical protein